MVELEQPAATTALARVARRARRTLDDAGSALLGRDVLALCSGGADSVALVAVLGALPRGAAPRSITVLHVDHGTGSESGAGVPAAAAVAERVGARFVARTVEHAAPLEANVEAAARRLRYDAATEVAGERRCTVVVTGHSADDQLEQALLSLVGVTGHAGELDAMPVERELAPDVLLVRPLLGSTHADHRELCAEHALPVFEDPTNADPDFAVRNALRGTVVPPLLAAHPSAGASIARAGARTRETIDARDALSIALLDAWQRDADPAALDVRDLAALPAAARRALIAAWLRRAGLGRALTERIVRAVDQLATAPARAACARVDLADNACVRRDGYDLRIAHPPHDTAGLAW